MEELKEALSMNLAQVVRVRAEWAEQGFFMSSEALYTFGKYLVCPINNIILVQEQDNKQTISQRLIIDNQATKESFQLIISNASQIQHININQFHIAFVQITHSYKQNNPIVKHGLLKYQPLQQPHLMPPLNQQYLQQIQAFSSIKQQALLIKQMIKREINKLQYQKVQSVMIGEKNRELSQLMDHLSHFEEKYNRYEQICQMNENNNIQSLKSSVSYEIISAYCTFVPLSEEIQQLDKEIKLEKMKNNSRPTEKLRQLLHQMALKFQENGNYQHAISVLKEQSFICLKMYGQFSQKYAEILFLLGQNYILLKQYETAFKYLEQALGIFKKIDEKSHSVARVLNCIGIVFKVGRDDYRTALQFYNQALKINRQLFGNKHEDVASNLNNIALIFQSQQQYEQAENTYKEVLQIKQYTYGKIHFTVALTVFNLSLCHLKMKKYSEWIEGKYRAFSIMKKLKLWNHPQNKDRVQTFKYFMGQTLKTKSLSKECLKKCLKMMSKIFDEQYDDQQINLVIVKISKMIQ